MDGRREWIVIGAGPAGLGTAAMLQKAGAEVLVVDGAGSVGSSWRGHYDRLHLHTVRWLSGLPGYPLPRSHGRWVGRDGFIRYLEEYARHHGLRMRLGARIESLQRADGEWLLDTSAGSLRADQVVVATGANRVPFVPPWPGRASFRGELVHSSGYRSGLPYRGKDVLVVGSGNSGAEIATDLVEAGASRVRISVRTPPNVVPRALLGAPLQVLGVLMRPLPARLADPMSALLSRGVFGDLSRHGLRRSPRGIVTRAMRDRTLPLIDVGFVRELERGRIEVVPAVEALDEAQVVLAGGARIQPQAVIAATGYRPGLEALVGHLGVLGPDGFPLADGAHTCPGTPGLYFVGFRVPISGVLREISHEARRIGRLAVRRQWPTAERRHRAPRP